MPFSFISGVRLLLQPAENCAFLLRISLMDNPMTAIARIITDNISTLSIIDFFFVKW